MLEGIQYTGSISCDDDESAWSSATMSIVIGVGIGAFSIVLFNGYKKWKASSSSRPSESEETRVEDGEFEGVPYHSLNV